MSPIGHTSSRTVTERARIALPGCSTDTPTRIETANAPQANPDAIGMVRERVGVVGIRFLHRLTSARAAKVDETISVPERDCEAAPSENPFSAQFSR